VDDRGIWREDDPGKSFGIAWDEIHSISGYKLDGITKIYTCVVFDWEYGEYLELNNDWDGFEKVLSAIPKHLPGILQNWYTKIEALTVKDESLIVWTKA